MSTWDTRTAPPLTIPQMAKLDRHLARQREVLIELAPETRWHHNVTKLDDDGNKLPRPPRPTTEERGYVVCKATKASTLHNDRWYVGDVNNRQAWHELVVDEATGKRCYWYPTLRAYAADTNLL